MSFKAVDAFCGAGGLTLGLQDAGFDVLAGFDLDPICIQTIVHNQEFIKHSVYEADVKTMLGGRLLELIGLEAGELDLLAGGPPCQGFSVQRTVGGDHDVRNLLVGDYGDLIIEVRPRFFLVENVPGIGGKRGRHYLDQLAAKMSSCGYAIHEAILDAQDFGVPQRRRRLVMVGERLLAGGISKFTWPTPSGTQAPTVRQAIGDLPSPPEDGTELPGYPNHRADRLSQLNKKRLRALRPGDGRTELPEELWAECHKVSAEIVGHRNVYGRMAWDEVAPTITARFDSFTRGKFGHPTETRSISLREGARLQTFPDAYTFVGTKVEVARQIGNAVPVTFAEAIGSSIAHSLSSDPSLRR